MDMTDHKEKFPIELRSSLPDEGEKEYYQVTYDLVVVVEGRNLRYEAWYPSAEDGTVQQAAQISIAAAFQPGTS